MASFHTVGTLLVLGLLIAPPATALPWARSVSGVMALAALLGRHPPRHRPGDRTGREEDRSGRRVDRAPGLAAAPAHPVRP
ncbi:metal ABC transporter permease [Streptomyces rhizosphaericola]|uniref:metal ABC transporter permease n=1 Tax=Streptomyces rhizosphaericola TaxID=2564098 RepID=UPI0039EE3ECD